MIQAARRVIFCIDSTKFGRQSISKLCDLDVIDVVVTDPGAPESFLALLRERSIQVRLANDGSGAPMPALPPALETDSGSEPEPSSGSPFEEVPLNVL